MRVAALRVQIRRITGRPVAALSTRVHHEVSIARACPEQPVDHETTPAAIADVFDHAGKLSALLFGEDQPAFDGLPAESCECDVEGFLRDETIIHAFEGCIQWEGTRLVKCGFPEYIKVRGFVAGRAVGLEFVERVVEECHGLVVGAW